MQSFVVGVYSINAMTRVGMLQKLEVNGGPRMAGSSGTDMISNRSAKSKKSAQKASEFEKSLTTFH